MPILGCYSSELCRFYDVILKNRLQFAPGVCIKISVAYGYVCEIHIVTFFDHVQADIIFSVYRRPCTAHILQIALHSFFGLVIYYIREHISNRSDYLGNTAQTNSMIQRAVMFRIFAKTESTRTSNTGDRSQG